jgi:hypothetical protein
LHLHVVERGGGEARRHRLLSVALVIEGADKAGDDERVGARERVLQLRERVGHAGRGLRCQKTNTRRIYDFAIHFGGLDHHLRALQRQSAHLRDGKRGQRHVFFEEHLAGDFTDPAQIARAGDERAQFDDGSMIRSQQSFECLPRLLREQTFGRERRHLEREAAGFGGNSGRQFGRQRKGLSGVVASLFLFVLWRDRRDVARVRIEFFVLRNAAPHEETEQDR